MFVADAFGVWLVEQLADAGRNKLTELILGSEQERALRRAADVAVWTTAEGAHEHAAALLARDPAAHATLDSPVDVARLREAGAHEHAAALAVRAAAHAPLDDPGSVVLLLDSLREAGAHEQAAVRRLPGS